MHRVTLDDDAEAFRQTRLVADLPKVETLTVDAARALLAEAGKDIAPTGPDMHGVEELTGAGIAMRLYRPRAGRLPVIVFCHGGGWVLRTLDDYDDFCRHFARTTGAAVISVDYRLAPEHPFPAAVEDTGAAIRWVSENAAALGLDSDRLVLAGDSAGGNLMAVAAIMARDGDLPVPRAQVLLYPGVDAARAHPSHAFSMEGLLLSGETMKWFYGHYLKPGQETDWRASPLLADSLEGVAPCVLLTVGADPLVDEGIAYAARLMREGCSVTHIHDAGQFHAYLSADPAGPATQAALRRIAGAIAGYLEGADSPA